MNVLTLHVSHWAWNILSMGCKQLMPSHKGANKPAHLWLVAPLLNSLGTLARCRHEALLQLVSLPELPPPLTGVMTSATVQSVVASLPWATEVASLRSSVMPVTVIDAVLAFAPLAETPCLVKDALEEPLASHLMMVSPLVEAMHSVLPALLHTLPLPGHRTKSPMHG